MIFLAVALGVSIYLWTTELFGQIAGIAALTIFALDPNILAHSQMIHTDVPFAALFFIGSYFLWRYLQVANWRNLLGLCLFSGLASVTKYSYSIMLLIWFVLSAWKIFSTEPQTSLFAGVPIVADRRQKAAGARTTV